MVIDEQTNCNEAPVLRCLSTHYGIEGRLSRLPGENINYLVTTGEGERYILKIVDDDMPPSVVELENAIINHALKAGFSYQLPEIIKNRSGRIESGISLRGNRSNRLRMLAFVEGDQLDSLSDISPKSLIELGKMLARFDRSLRNFDHPAAHRNHRWNLAEADQHRSKIDLVGDGQLKRLLGWAFDCWADQAKSAFPGLPHQIIHGDAHGENVLVSGQRITGLVDFGDCCYNPVICELGVCLPYMMMGQDDPLDVAAHIVAGYHHESPISNPERSTLFSLICARLAVTICVAEERRLIDPHHPNWFGDSGRAGALLCLLHEEPELGRQAFLL